MWNPSPFNPINVFKIVIGTPRYYSFQRHWQIRENNPIRALILKWQVVKPNSLKLLHFSHIWHVFKQTHECDRRRLHQERQTTSIITKHLTSVWSMACFCFSAAHCPRIHQLNNAEKTYIHVVILAAEWSKCCPAGFINFYSPVRLRGKTCFNFSTQNYVRFWYYCEIRCRRGIVILPCRAQPTK